MASRFDPQEVSQRIVLYLILKELKRFDFPPMYSERYEAKLTG